MQDTQHYGVLVQAQSKGTFTENDIACSRAAGVRIIGESQTVLIGNVVRDGKRLGCLVEEHSQVLLRGMG